MSRHTSALEWTFLEEDDDQMPWSESEPGAINGREKKRNRRFVWGLCIALLVVALGTGAYLWRGAELGLRAIERELQTALEIEQWQAQNAALSQESGAVSADDRSVTMAATPEGPYPLGDAPSLEVTMEDFSFYQNLAVAPVRLTRANANGPASVYRRLAFFRPANGEWVRTGPVPAYWGKQDTYETTHFLWRHRRRDAALVAAVAARLDAGYAQIRHEFQLPSPAQKITIEVDAGAPSQNVTFANVRNHHIRMPGPDMYLIPDHLAKEQVLFLWLLDPLLRQVLDEVEQEWDVGPPQQPFATALRRWYLLDQNPLAQEWRQDLVQLMVGVASREQSSELLDAQVRHLCEEHQIRDQILLMKGDDSAAHLCLNPSQTDFVRLSRDGLPLRLSNGQSHRSRFTRELRVFSSSTEQWALSWMDAEALLSLYDYVISEYGRAMLPPLLLAANRYASWQELIPELFGVSIEQFEADGIGTLGWFPLRSEIY